MPSTAGVDQALVHPSRADAAAVTTLRTQTRLVLVPVLVTDGNGKHIAGLKAEDFELKQNGRPQDIRVFEEVVTRPSARSVRPAGAAATYTNTLETGGAQRIFIFALDTINTPFSDLKYGREQLVKYLTENVTAGELVSLVSIERGGRVRVLHDFTSDSKVLVAALKKVRGHADASQGVDASESQDLNEQETTELNQDVQSMQSWQTFLASPPDANAVPEQRRMAILDTLTALQQIAQSVMGIPGRKELVWTSAGSTLTLDGFQLTNPANPLQTGTQDILPHYAKTWRLMSDANLAVYPIDVRGLVGASNSASIGATPGRRIPASAQTMNNATGAAQLRQMQTLATFDTFADTTGGRAFYNSNNLAKSVAKAVEDSSAYYLLGYYLDKDVKPGWQKLGVQAKHSRAHVRARSGFFTSVGRQDSEAEGRADLQIALKSPVNFSGLPMSVEIKSADYDPVSKKRQLKFDIVLPENALTIDEADSNHVWVDLAAAAWTGSDVLAGHYASSVDAHPAAETVRRIHGSKSRYHCMMEVPPDDLTVRVAVRDHLGARVGSVNAHLNLSLP